MPTASRAASSGRQEDDGTGVVQHLGARRRVLAAGGIDRRKADVRRFSSRWRICSPVVPDSPSMKTVATNFASVRDALALLAAAAALGEQPEIIHRHRRAGDGRHVGMIVGRRHFSTTSSSPTKSIDPSARRIASASRDDRPPATGVPVPGAKAGSRASMSNVRVRPSHVADSRALCGR